MKSQLGNELADVIHYAIAIAALNDIDINETIIAKDKYASEADMLNVALFNKRAKQWREENPDLKGNMRDYASLNELLVLANMESYNAILIGKGMEQKERMMELRKLARTQLMSLEKLGDSGIKRLEGK